jgi:hypothetical protein
MCCAPSALHIVWQDVLRALVMTWLCILCSYLAGCSHQRTSQVHARLQELPVERKKERKKWRTSLFFLNLGSLHA